ncbi:MAG: anaerobic ribonucleoside-triphosphate reductase activating protein [Clostridiales bacterium]|nr:anaerobic ribonucleoside-triphosphate reductase activating protein [Clostridiales bacterium]
MNYAEIKTNDIANGESVRTSLFVSGCRHRCKNCFNEIAWDFSSGKEFTDETAEYILSSCDRSWIDGLSLLGGEPFEPENQGELLRLVAKFKSRFPTKSIWCYSGFTFEEITGKAPSRAFTDISGELLSKIDILVDGRFVEEKKDITLVFRGSSNQRIIDVKKTLENNEIEIYLK